MTRTVRKTPQAFLDLDAIAEFIRLDNPQAAVRFLDLLEGRCLLLAEQPGIGRLRPDLAAESLFFPIMDYVIFYRQTATVVEIIRVLHGARDIEAIFDE